MRIDTLGNVADVVNGFAFAEDFQGNKTAHIPFIKVSDFVFVSNRYIDRSINYVDETILKKLGAKIYPKGTVIFPKVGGALLTNKRAILGCEATFDNNIMGLVPKSVNSDLLYYFMRSYDMAKIANTTSIPSVRASDVAVIKIMLPSTEAEENLITNKLILQFAEIEKAREATELQLQEVTNLANAIIFESLNKSDKTTYSLGDVLEEVKHGIGSNWRDYPVYGATRKGIALAKEPPGKQAQKYKPVIPGTVFYNPMRILIGSIAFAEEDVIDGITSPDYVVLKGKEGLIDSRWFYFWLRSPLGEQCINSLARGAVRERMLFNRLAEGQIELPDYTIQKEASKALSNLKSLSINLVQQLKEIGTLPNRILAQAFSEIEKG